MLNSGIFQKTWDYAQKNVEVVQLFAPMNCVESFNRVEPLNVKIYLGTLKLVLWPLRLYIFVVFEAIAASKQPRRSPMSSDWLGSMLVNKILG